MTLLLLPWHSVTQEQSPSSSHRTVFVCLSEPDPCYLGLILLMSASCNDWSACSLSLTEGVPGLYKAVCHTSPDPATNYLNTGPRLPLSYTSQAQYEASWSNGMTPPICINLGHVEKECICNLQSAHCVYCSDNNGFLKLFNLLRDPDQP